MADNLPRDSFTIDMFEVIAGNSLLENLENGSLTRETAYSKKRKMAVRYHSKDIEKCYLKVRRLNNYAIVMTVTDLEKNLDETQGTPIKKKFDELEEVIIGLQDTEKNLKQINEEMRRKDQVLSQELRRKDEEMRQELRQKEEMRQELRRTNEEMRQKDEEMRQKDEEMRQVLRQKEEMRRVLRQKDEEMRQKEEELRRVLRQKDEEMRRKEEEMRQQLRQELSQKEEVLRQELRRK